MDYKEFDEMFKGKYKLEFEVSDNLAEFASAIGGSYGDLIAKYANSGWADKLFATRKAGKYTHRPLEFPEFNKFSDVFERAILRESAYQSRYADGLLFIGGSAAVSGNFGGKRGWSKTLPDVRSVSGSRWMGTYVRPVEAVLQELSGDVNNWSFEAIRRVDGILITACDSTYIGGDWLALLDLSESIEPLFDSDTRAFLAKERAADEAAWPTLTK